MRKGHPETRVPRLIVRLGWERTRVQNLWGVNSWFLLPPSVALFTSWKIWTYHDDGSQLANNTQCNHWLRAHRKIDRTEALWRWRGLMRGWGATTTLSTLKAWHHYNVLWLCRLDSVHNSAHACWYTLACYVPFTRPHHDLVRYLSLTHINNRKLGSVVLLSSHVPRDEILSGHRAYFHFGKLGVVPSL